MEKTTARIVAVQAWRNIILGYTGPKIEPAPKPRLLARCYQCVKPNSLVDDAIETSSSCKTIAREWSPDIQSVIAVKAAIAQANTTAD